MNRWPRAPLGEVCEQDRNQVSNGNANGLPFVGLEHVESGTGDIDLSEGGRTGEGKSTTFRFDERHVLYGKLRPYLNKVAVPHFAGRCSTELIPLLPNPDLLREYLGNFLRQRRVVDAVMAANTGSRMPRADMKVLLAQVIPLPPLPEQRRIVDILNRAAGIRRLRREAREKARQLIPALFVDMFGDPATNSERWPMRQLSEVSEIRSGVTKGRKIDRNAAEEIPYLRVANVQDGHLSLNEIKTIPVRPTEIETYRLQPGDLVLTEGGDPDKLGRGALWSGEIEVCVHQNHVFRVRADRGALVPEYARAMVGSDYGKRYFLRVAKQTTGIASINKTQLGNFPALIPPLDLQHAFADRVADIQATIARQDRMAEAADRLRASLAARLFDGDGAAPA